MGSRAPKRPAHLSTAGQAGGFDEWFRKASSSLLLYNFVADIPRQTPEESWLQWAETAERKKPSGCFS